MCGHGMVAAVERQPWLDRLDRRDVGSVPRKAKYRARRGTGPQQGRAWLHPDSLPVCLQG
jgi:hypothetical protein